MEVDCGSLSAFELYLPDLAVDRILLINRDPLRRNDSFDLGVAEIVVLIESQDWFMRKIFRRFVVVLPRSVALVELIDDESHDRYHYKDDGKVDQKGSAYAEDP